jgi:hypothetical protein
MDQVNRTPNKPTEVVQRHLEGDREYSPKEYYNWFGGPPPSTQAKQRLKGTGCRYLKRGSRVTILGRFINEHRKSLERVSTSDPGGLASPPLTFSSRRRGRRRKQPIQTSLPNENPSSTDK